MTDRIERELSLPASAADVWRAITDPEWLSGWLADEVELELLPGRRGELPLGDEVRTGWVEEVSAPGRRARCGHGAAGLLVGRDDEPASRVELVLTAIAERETRLRVVETRPLEVLDLVGIPLGGYGPTRFGPRWWRPDDGRRSGRRRVRRPRRPDAPPAADRDLRASVDRHRARDELPISRQAVTKHLSSLSEAGLLERERAGRDVRYRVTPAPLSSAVSWMAEVGGQWDDRLARLAGALSDLPEQEGPGRRAQTSR